MSSDELRQQADAWRDLETLRREVPFDHRDKFADVFRRINRCIPTIRNARPDSYDQQKQSIYTDTQRILLRLKQDKA